MRFSSDYELYQTISKNIIYYREQKGLTQVQLAEEAKISISYLSKIKAAGLNKSFSISVLNQIAKAAALPSGIRLQPLIFTYLLAPHCQMRYSSHAQNTPLKSSSTSLTILPRPGEKLWMYSSTTAAKSPKNRI